MRSVPSHLRELGGSADVYTGTKMINGAPPMPILLWLLGVPITLVIVLMLAGVV